MRKSEQLANLQKKLAPVLNPCGRCGADSPVVDRINFGNGYTYTISCRRSGRDGCGDFVTGKTIKEVVQKWNRVY